MATEPASLLQDASRIAGTHPDHETEPVDYGALNDRITGPELIPLSAATFALSKVIARERIGTWMREPFVHEDDGQQPRGRRLRRAMGELLTCTRCVGAWSALGIVGLRLAAPSSGRVVTNVLAASAANDFLQAGFRALCAQAERVSR